MERERRTNLLGLGALTLLVAAATIGLARVFVAGSALPTLLAGALGSLAIAALLRRLPGILAALLAEIAVAWLVVALVARGTLENGFPTLRSGQALLRSLADAIAAGRTTVAPVPATRPFLAAALLAIGAAVVAAHAALIRGRRPLLAIVPLVALPAFADLALGRRAPLVVPLALVAGSVAVVLADGIRRVRTFATLPATAGPRAFAVATRGSRATIVGVALAALAVPPLLPWVDDEPALDLSAGTGSVTRVDPFVSIRAQLTMPDRFVLLRVETDDPPTYQRMFALERFDGVTWTAGTASYGPPMATPADLAAADALGPAPTISQEIQVVGGIAGGGFLPIPYPAARVSFPRGPIAEDLATGALRLESALIAGDRYVVEALRPVPRPSDLRSRDPRLAGAVRGELVDLPDDLRPALTRIAQRWTEGATTPYDQIIAIQEHLLDGSFRYTLDVPEDQGGRSLLRFLTRTRAGFCQQFATAMAALVRSLGYPARVAVGFREGRVADGAWEITNQDAHSWVEVPFPGFGWLPFEPTPGRPNPVGGVGSYLDPNEGGDEAPATDGATAASPAPRTCVVDGRELPAQFCRAEADRIDPEGGDAGRQPIEEETFAPAERPLPVVPIAGGAVLLLLLAVPFARDAARRRRIARAGSPRARAIAALRAFEGVGRELGVGRDRGETLREFASRLAADHPRIDEDLAVLVGVASRAAYGDEGPSDDEAMRAVVAGHRATTGLRGDAGWTRRLAGAYRVGD